MLIVGEKLNSTIPSVRKAIEDRDIEFVQDLARRQAEAGADFIDVNTAGGSDEVKDMEWLVKAVQEVVEIPLCIDTIDLKTARKGLQAHRGKAMLNSISLEKNRLEGMLPLAKEFDCSLVALTMDDNGIPKTAEERIKITGQLVEVLDKAQVNLNEVYIDPLVLPLSVSTENALIFFKCLQEIKRNFPVKTISGLSNVSHALPQRKLINRYFLTICLAHGMDAAIMNPLDFKLTSAVIAAEAILNKDRFNLNYLKAYRSGALDE